MSGPRHLFLIDGSGFIFRAYYARGMRPLTRSDGTPVTAVYIYSNMLNKLRDDTEADAIAVVFDAARENFRNEIYPEYKANRREPPDALLYEVYKRTGDKPFKHIDDVISQSELAFLLKRYQRVAGFDKERLEARAS